MSTEYFVYKVDAYYVLGDVRRILTAHMRNHFYPNTLDLLPHCSSRDVPLPQLVTVAGHAW